jgi:SAM-dependent methyltransferase
MQKQSHISRLSIKSAKSEATFEFATPDQFPAGTGSINVICGENAVGKSYIVRALEGLSSEENRKNLYQTGYEVAFSKQDVVPLVINAEPWKNLSFAGQMFFDKQSDFSKSKDRKFHIVVEFWFGIVAAHHKATTSNEIDCAKWMSDFEYRSELFANMQVEEGIGILTFLNSPLIEQFEELFDCEIGFRKKDRKVRLLEVMMDTDFGRFGFANWSQGQKTVFNFLQTLHYSKCSVFLIDEIENNLHSKFISKIMRAIKSSGKQFTITSHHPHVIFSKFTDRAFFIERKKPHLSRRGTVYESENKKTTIDRTVYVLGQNMDKIKASYSLFEEADAELLQQAGYVKQALLSSVYGDIFAVMDFEVKPAKKSVLPDGQTSLMSECLNSIGFGNAQKLCILDYGSGLCRVAGEFSKVASRAQRQLDWIFWEPNAELRVKAQKSLAKEIQGRHLESAPNALELAGKVDVILVSNVIHELTPSEISNVLTLASQILRHGGYLVINEIYPLLEFEENAVPFRPEEMKSLLSRCGFDVELLVSNLRNTTAYVAIAKYRSPPSRGLLVEVEAAWQEVLASRLTGHGIGVRPTSPNRVTERIQGYATIATIAKFFNTGAKR